MSLTYGFYDENNIVKHLLLFETHDEQLLEQVKNHFSLSGYAQQTEENPIYINGELFNGKFYPPKQYSSWIRNEELAIWEAPIPYPAFDEENPKFYTWNESLLNWEEIQVSE